MEKYSVNLFGMCFWLDNFLIEVWLDNLLQGILYIPGGCCSEFNIYYFILYLSKLLMILLSN